MIRYLLCTLLFFNVANALDIDEKLTVRLLNVSETKKTVLVNRGLEDGLVVGDHAKFFLTEGVVARGVVVKASPSRSIWSLYRLVTPDDIVTDKVFNVKISSPVKLTEDGTKMLTEDNLPLDKKTEKMSLEEPAPKNIALAGDADDLPKDLSDDEQEDLRSLKDEVKHTSTGRSWEVFGILNYNGLNSVSTTGSNNKSYDGANSTMDISIGLEKYLGDWGEFLRSFSVYGLATRSSYENTSMEGDTVSGSFLGAGIGGNWHFLANPLSQNELIAFIGGNYGMGKSTDGIALKRPEVTTNDVTYKGDASFFSFGIGAKYYTTAGIGIRMLVDYYRRAETYAVENSTSNYTKLVSGPRILLGISYRW